MRTRARITLTALVAAVALTQAVATASANHLSVSSRTFRLTSGALSFEFSGTSVTCEVTMEGSFTSSTFAKVAEATIGSITSTTVSNCRGGSVTVLTEGLPWSLAYERFTGTLPSIIHIYTLASSPGYDIHATSLEATCLMGSTAIPPIPRPKLLITYDPPRRVITSFTWDRTSRLTGGVLCELAGEATMRAEGEITVPRSTTSITVTLI